MGHIQIVFLTFIAIIGLQTFLKNEAPLFAYGSEVSDIFNHYCQFLDNPLSGTENHVDSDIFSLHGLFVITRHGERLPLLINTTKKQSCKAFSQSGQKVFKNYQQKIESRDFQNFVFIDQAFHGLPWYPNPAHCEAGNMTSEGALQVLQLADYLSKTYQTSGIFHGSSISITATTNFRTFQSAIAMISNLFYQLPMNLNSVNQTVFCDDSEDCHCNMIPRLRTLYEQKHSQDFKHFYPDLSTKLNSLASMLDVPPFDIPLQFFDVILGRYACRHQPLPCLSKTHCITPSLVTQTLNSINHLFKATYINHKNIYNVEAYTLAKKVVDYIQKLRQNPHFKEVQIFSGHRTTIMPFIFTFGFNVTNVVPVYASRLIFEVYRAHIPSENESIFVRVLLNGYDHTYDLPFCDKLYYGLCYGRDFENFVNLYLFSSVTDICLNSN